MKNLKLLAFLTLTILNYSCSKSDDNPEPEIIEETPKVNVVGNCNDTTNTGGNDTTNTGGTNILLGMWHNDSIRLLLVDSATLVEFSNTFANNSTTTSYLSVVQDTMYNAPNQVVNFNGWIYYVDNGNNTLDCTHQNGNSWVYSVLQITVNKLFFRRTEYINNNFINNGNTYLQDQTIYYSK